METSIWDDLVGWALLTAICIILLYLAASPILGILFIMHLITG